MYSFKKALRGIKNKKEKNSVNVDKEEYINLAKKLYDYFSKNEYNDKAYFMYDYFDEDINNFKNNNTITINIISFIIKDDFYYDRIPNKYKGIDYDIEAYKWINKNIIKPMCDEFDFKSRMEVSAPYLMVCENKEKNALFIYDGDHDSFEYMLQINK
ncbi:MAG: hypothetical protein ACOCRK_02915 [bacterium]